MPEKILLDGDKLRVPAQPIIPFITGDGIGVDITPAMRQVVDAAVAAGADGRQIHWLEVPAGEQANKELGQYLPQSSLDTLREHVVGIKGPLSTPVGGGFRSLNVTIRQVLDLYSCIRPVRWYGSASPLKEPKKLDLVIFRENTEDVYAGVEFDSLSAEAKRIIALLRELGIGQGQLPDEAAIGIKPMSPGRSKRHMRKALRWTLAYGRKSVTLMHKGNIMKSTEGAFRRWGYEVIAEEEFVGHFLAEADGEAAGKIPVNDRIADNMFQQILTRTADYDVIVAPNLNGDYLSDSAAAGVGGLGMAPGANIGDGLAVFEATHGTAPKYAGLDKINPGSLILSAAMMLDYLGWTKAAKRIEQAMSQAMQARLGTYDLVRGWRNEGEDNLTELSCSEFAAALIDRL